MLLNDFCQNIITPVITLLSLTLFKMAFITLVIDVV